MIIQQREKSDVGSPQRAEDRMSDLNLYLYFLIRGACKIDRRCTNSTITMIASQFFTVNSHEWRLCLLQYELMVIAKTITNRNSKSITARKRIKNALSRTKRFQNLPHNARNLRQELCKNVRGRQCHLIWHKKKKNGNERYRSSRNRFISSNVSSSEMKLFCISLLLFQVKLHLCNN